jgi:branched-chain amino acid transport system substrate-binding protein
VVRDDRGDPATGRDVAVDLVNHEKVVATIGFCNTGVAMMALDVFEMRRQVLIVPCAQGTAITRRTPAASSFMFRVAPSDAMNAEFLADEIVDRRKLTRVALLVDTTGHGDGGVADIRAQLERRGLLPVYVGRFAPDAHPCRPNWRRRAQAAPRR